MAPTADDDDAAIRPLLDYLEATMCEAIEFHELQKALDGCVGEIDWSARSEDGETALHLVCMNDTTEPEELSECIRFLLARGASPAVKDNDGDAVLEAVLKMAAEPMDDEEEDVQELSRRASEAAICTLLEHPATEVTSELAGSVCQFVRRNSEADKEKLLGSLRKRCSAQLVDKLWASEQLLEYLEVCCYDQKKSVEAKRIAEFLAQGASPSAKQNGASAFLLCVLNPFSSIQELAEVFRILIQVEPSSAGIADGFGLRPLGWASDYVNLQKQYGLATANPAALLALMPLIISMVPQDVECGEQCLKTSAVGYCSAAPPPNAPRTRFLEGHRVLCRVQEPGAAFAWEEGTIIGLWYREKCWPSSHPGACYEVRLDIGGGNVYVLVDDDRLVRDEAASTAKRTSGGYAAAADAKSSPTAAKAKAAAPAKRFQRRQKEDGSWEMLDTVSGKTRPCPPPDSDSED
eukprot:TRINITY_DN26322_c0_g1_i2.p1 TRINITY_DN26322_c0_g1~~TRINITY_DN26322_c0_g1_i2.p1  ORF type:complete len:463 (-),score=135.15 TRINITY_DN26322_c0_g1_i2:610-1998(-)